MEEPVSKRRVGCGAVGLSAIFELLSPSTQRVHRASALSKPDASEVPSTLVQRDGPGVERDDSDEFAGIDGGMRNRDVERKMPVEHKEEKHKAEEAPLQEDDWNPFRPLKTPVPPLEFVPGQVHNYKPLDNWSPFVVFHPSERAKLSDGLSEASKRRAPLRLFHTEIADFCVMDSVTD